MTYQLSPTEKRAARELEILLDASVRAGITSKEDAETYGLDHLLRPEPMKGEEIRALRLKLELSQSLFAKHIYISKDYLSKLERGKKEATGSLLHTLRLIEKRGLDNYLL